MKIIHRKNIRRILSAQAGDSMVIVKSAKYGFIWAGRAKFTFTNFRNEFFSKFPEQVNRDSTGALVIIMN